MEVLRLLTFFPLPFAGINQQVRRVSLHQKQGLSAHQAPLAILSKSLLQEDWEYVKQIFADGRDHLPASPRCARVQQSGVVRSMVGGKAAPHLEIIL